MRTIILKTFLLAGLLLAAKTTFAQLPMKRVLELAPTDKLPFDATKTSAWSNSYAIDNSNKVIPEKLYENVQLTKYYIADEDQEGASFRKFLLPSGYYIVVVSFGGATEWRTDVLCVVDKEGNVLSTLEGLVTVADITVKQYRITENGSTIYVSQVKPSSSTSLSFDNVTSFQGYVETVTYGIKDGKFFSITGSTSSTKTFTKELLSNPGVNVWQY